MEFDSPSDTLRLASPTYMIKFDVYVKYSRNNLTKVSFELLASDGISEAETEKFHFITVLGLYNVS